MLNLTRKLGEKIHLGNLATITFSDVKGSYITLSIEAPRGLRILRAEIPGAENMGYQGDPTMPVLGKQPIETAPKDGTYILLFGDSGYITTPERCEVCRWDKDYPKTPWRTYSNDSFEDSGGPPTHWMPLPR